MVAQVVGGTAAGGIRLAAEPVPEAMEQVAGVVLPGLGMAVAGALQNALEGGYSGFLVAHTDHEIAWDLMEKDSSVEAFATAADERDQLDQFHATLVKIIKFLLIRD